MSTETDTFGTRELRLWDPLGQPIQFNLKTFLEVIEDKRFLLFGGLALVLFFATDPSNNREYVPLWVSAAIWPVAYVVYMTGYGTLLSGLSLLTRVWSRLRVPTILIAFTALVPAVYICEELVLHKMSNGLYPNDLRGNFLFYFLAVLVIEAVFFRFVFPILVPQEDSALPAVQTAANDDETLRHVIIGGERIPLHKIRTIEARAHHVQVTMIDAETRLRARLGDIVAQTNPNDGVQTHRSWWVSRAAASAVVENEGRPSLRLICNGHVPIARTRVDDVQAWASEHLQA